MEVGGLELAVLHPPDAEELISEEAFEREEFLPYWAELWPSAIALGRVVAARELAGLRVLELGCGLGLPSVVAALRGAEVLATDWSDEALAVAALNAERNGARIETARLAWADAVPAGGPWDLIIGADLLYERRNVDQLLALLPRLGTRGPARRSGPAGARRLPRGRRGSVDDRAAAGRRASARRRAPPPSALTAEGLCCNNTSSGQSIFRPRP